MQDVLVVTCKGASGVRLTAEQIYLDKPEFPPDIIWESNHARAKWI